MQEDKKRELIPVSTQAHEHLRKVVEAHKANGLPTSGTLLASQAILSLPIPEPQPQPKAKSKIVEKKRRTHKSKPVQAIAVQSAL